MSFQTISDWNQFPVLVQLWLYSLTVRISSLVDTPGLIHIMMMDLSGYCFGLGFLQPEVLLVMLDCMSPQWWKQHFENVGIE